VRRALLSLALALLLAWLTARAEALPRQSAEAYLAELYAAEARRIAKGEELGREELLALFVPAAAELVRAALAHPDAALRDAAAPNPLFGWKVAKGVEARVVAVTVVLGTRIAPTLIVDAVVSLTPRRIVVDLVEDEGSWLIASIIYDEGEDWLSFERRLARR
jgi:hypothetical protein